MEYFIWKNEKSTDKNILIKNMPIVPKAEKNIEKIEIEGRSGALYEDKNTYKTISYQLECNMGKKGDIREIKSWLDGFSNVIFSNNKDVFYKGALVNQLDIEIMVKYFKSFQLDFELQPFAYSIEKYIKKFTSGIEQKFNISESTFNMKPYIKIIGNNTINLTINNNTIVINPEEYIEIDTELQIAYKGTENSNNKILGDLNEINLKPGENNITILGEYTEIEIQYRKVFI